MRSVVAAWFGQLLKARTAIEAQRRQQEKSNHLDVSMKYRWMVQQWNKEPRWKTADEIYAAVMKPDESLQEQRAKELAWQVFFIFKILPYEEAKTELNGDIEDEI